MTYEYADVGGDKLYVFAGSGATHVGVQRWARRQGVLIPNADAPAVALELLKAAGQESVIVPKAYNEVVDDCGVLRCGDGPEYAAASDSTNPSWLYQRAANFIAIADYIEGKAARDAAEKAKAEAAEKIEARRDALTAEFSGGLAGYKSLSHITQNVIDHVIELQDQLAAK